MSRVLRISLCRLLPITDLSLGLGLRLSLLNLRGVPRMLVHLLLLLLLGSWRWHLITPILSLRINLTLGCRGRRHIRLERRIRRRAHSSHGSRDGLRVGHRIWIYGDLDLRWEGLEVWVAKCVGGAQALIRVKLEEAVQEVDSC